VDAERFSRSSVRRDTLSFTDYLWRLLVSVLVLAVISSVISFVFGVGVMSWSWLFVSCLLITIVLSFLVRYSRLVNTSDKTIHIFLYR